MTCNSMINPFSLGLNNSIQSMDTSFIRLGLKFVFLNLGPDFSENFFFFCLSRRILIPSFSMSRPDFRF